MKEGRSPTEGVNLANGAAPQRGALAGGRGRPDRKRVLHADEEPQLARAPHHRLPDEAVHDYPPDRDGERLRGQGRVQHRQRLSHGARSPAPFAKEIAAWPPTAGSIGRGLGQRGGAVAQKRSGPAAGRHFRRDPAPPSPTGAAGTTAARLAAAERSRSPAAIPRNG